MTISRSSGGEWFRSNAPPADGEHAETAGPRLFIVDLSKLWNRETLRHRPTTWSTCSSSVLTDGWETLPQSLACLILDRRVHRFIHHARIQVVFDEKRYDRSEGIDSFSSCISSHVVACAKKHQFAHSLAC
jgi:hypothetical protein